MDVLSIEDVYLSTSDTDEEITLKLAPAGLAMKSKSTLQITTVKKEDIREVEYFWSVRKLNIRIFATSIININNIPEKLIDQLKNCMSKWYNLNMYQKELSIENTTTGKLTVTDNFLEFGNTKSIFDIPLQAIESVHEMKNELTLSFKESLNAVVEIKFTTENRNISKEIAERSDTGKSKEIVTFETLQSIVPRGKNDYIFYDNMFKMVGSTYEHRILYGSVKHIFYLQKENKENYLAVQIDPPIKQGQTRYSFIVMIFNPEVEEDFTLNLSAEDGERFEGLKKEYSGSIGESFLSVLRSITMCKVTTIGAFKTLMGGKSLKCSLKAYDGHLYPLEKALLFLPRAIYMPLNEIQIVEFSRINISAFAAKTFDMKISTVDKVYTFNSLPKEDFGQLEQYFEEKNIKVTSEVLADENSYSTEDEAESDLVDESGSADE